VGQEIAARPEAARGFAALKRAMEETLTILGFDLTEDLATGVRIREVASAASMGTSVDLEALKISGDILKKVRLRDEARQRKDWAIADRLRDELHAEGWVIEDTPEGPILSHR
jgi:cysteinyl-tRNA synthetase